MNLHPFNPQRAKSADLEKIFVKRHKTLNDTVEKMRASVLTKSKHHVMFVGPRGAGKTCMLTLVQHRLANMDDLKESMRIAWLNEDEISSNFLHFLMRIYRALSARYPREFPDDVRKKYAGMKPDAALEQVEKDIIADLNGKTCVVITENTDAMLDIMKPLEHRKWRAFLQNHQQFATLASSQKLTAQITNQKETFHGFFDVQHLAELNAEDAMELLKKLTAIRDGREDSEMLAFLATEKGWSRMQAIHHLAGGNPRLYVMLAEIITPQKLDDLVELFEELVEKQLTPYYQERIRWLSPLQREIVEFLCQQETRIVPVKTIAEGLFREQTSISPQLKELKSMNYVIAEERGREVYYQLAEPMMRLSIQTKEAGSEPLRMIVDFLRVLYDKEQLGKVRDLVSEDGRGMQYLQKTLALMESEPNFVSDVLMEKMLSEPNPTEKAKLMIAWDAEQNNDLWNIKLREALIHTVTCSGWIGFPIVASMSQAMDGIEWQNITKHLMTEMRYDRSKDNWFNALRLALSIILPKKENLTIFEKWRESWRELILEKDSQIDPAAQNALEIISTTWHYCLKFDDGLLINHPQEERTLIKQLAEMAIEHHKSTESK